MRTVGEMLEYYPRDWVFMPEPIAIARMQEGQKVSLMGLVESTDYLSHRRKPVFEVMLADETGYCRVLWFHGGYLVNQLEPGKYILVHGTVSKYKHMLQLANPKFIILEGPRAEAGCPGVTPVYRQTVDMLDYPAFRAKGYDLGSGPTESFCKTLTSRLKGSGMRWDKPHAEGLMALAAIRGSNLWERYWKLAKTNAA